MSGEQFLEKYKNRRWIFLIDNEKVRDFILSYTNISTQRNTIVAIYNLLREIRKTESNFEIDNLLTMNPVQARRKIWQITQSYMEREKYRSASLIRTYVSAFYDYCNEESGQSIKWQRKHKIPNIKVREGEVPNHSQFYRLIDVITHTKSKAIFLLSYSSGLKGSGILNLKVKHLKEAIAFREKLRKEFVDERNKIVDPESLKEINTLIENLPLIIKITSSIYFKRFQNGGSHNWYPAIICKDAENILMKYFERARAEANDNDYLFVSRTGKPFDQVGLSKFMRYNLQKFYKLTRELGDTSPSLLRRSFYNRLISGNMKDIYREYLMGHSLGVKKHYFSWEAQKKEIIIQYLKCNFNRMAHDVSKEISTLKEDSLSKDEKIKRLEEKLRYFESPEFTKSLVLEVSKFNETITPSKPSKVITKVIEIGDAKAWKELNKEGYYLVSSDDEHFVLQKEIEE